MTTTETTRDNFFASLTHRERGFLKVNGGKGSAKRAKSQRVKESKSQRDKETKSQRDKESKSQRDKESKRQRVKETKRRGRFDDNGDNERQLFRVAYAPRTGVFLRTMGAKGRRRSQRDKETKRQRVKETGAVAF